MLSTKVRKKSVSQMRTTRLLAVLLVPVVALIFGAATPQVWAQEIAEAEVFFEFNSTDLDLGFDIFLDGDPWVNATVTAPDGTIFIVDTGAGLNEKGNTEIMTESAEPPFSDSCFDPENCTPQEIADAITAFQSFFPAGTYTFDVEFQAGGNLSTTAELSHDLPAAPDILRPKEDSKLKNVKAIKWSDTSDAGDPEIITYEVVAEMVIDGETFVNTATLPGDATQFTISKEFRKLAKRAKKQKTLEEFKVEIVARGDNLNKTIAERVIFEKEEEEEEE